MNEIIKLINLTKSYDGHTKVLDGINLSINNGEIAVITGQSGSGKSTLLNILGLLDVQTSGEYYLDNMLIDKKSNFNYARIRNRKISFIFQAYHLIPNLTVKDNLIIPLLYRDGLIIDLTDFNEKVDYYLQEFDLKSSENKRVDELSGGEKQRIGLCRALIADPEIILADEPTGNLDNINKIKIMDIFREISKNLKKTIIIVTHDYDFCKIANRKFHLTGGKIIEEII